MNRHVCTIAALLAVGVTFGLTVPVQAQQVSDRPATSQPVKVQGKAMRPEMRYLRGTEALTLSAAQKRTLAAQRAAAKAALRRD